MQQIADWLKTLGTSEYAERFVEHGIDVSVLRHLTGKCFVVRSAPRPAASRAIRAAGVALLPTVRQAD
jgi:hypothetical protein